MDLLNVNRNGILSATKGVLDIESNNARAETDSSFNLEINLILSVANRIVLRVAKVQANRPTTLATSFYLPFQLISSDAAAASPEPIC